MTHASPSSTISHKNNKNWEYETPADLSPYGEIESIFRFGSDYTDLQREEKLREIKGKVIEWDLPVYEVQRTGNEYRVIFLQEIMWE